MQHFFEKILQNCKKGIDIRNYCAIIITELQGCNTFEKEENIVVKQDLYPELCGKIREKFRTQRAFATEIGMNPTTLSKRLSGESQWGFDEVARACYALGIPMADAPNFFTPNVARLQLMA